MLTKVTFQEMIIMTWHVMRRKFHADHKKIHMIKK